MNHSLTPTHTHTHNTTTTTTTTYHYLDFSLSKLPVERNMVKLEAENKVMIFSGNSRIKSTVCLISEALRQLRVWNKEITCSVKCLCQKRVLICFYMAHIYIIYSFLLPV
jgi:hypothetical protein